MYLLMTGIAVLLVTIVSFWALLPRGEKLHRWANTEWEPYVSVALCAGIALSFTMILSSIFDMMGKA
jgi:hypothetical protein